MMTAWWRESSETWPTLSPLPVPVVGVGAGVGAGPAEGPLGPPPPPQPAIVIVAPPSSARAAAAEIRRLSRSTSGSRFFGIMSSS